ncbi:trans-sulfuration enzyme family protein [Haliangium sp.]|uniref:trans-sulfuration enzyme family protein n=1 Tax=Haliangium sp. TaxID=2663208 RepID=UPI003D10FAB7
MSDPSKGFSTLAVHAGEPHRKAHGAITTPISCTATYVFDDTAEMRDHFEGRIEREEYGRYGNPTVRVAERKIAAIGGGEECAIFSSGMAAITTTLLAMLRSGQHVILTSDCYRRTRQFITGVLSRFGVDSTIVAPDDYDALAAAIRPKETRLVISESPTNPYLRCLDLERVGAITAKHPAVKLLIDATFATPVNQRPLEQGADLVFHSCTKYLAGHNDMLGGAVVGPEPLVSALRDFRGVLGGILDAHSAYLLIRGLKTLELRVTRQNQTALQVAEALEAHPKIARVYYPGLASHPDHEVAVRHMSGFGGVVSFLVEGDLDRTSRFVDGCQLPVIGPSLGGVESLIEQPALMSFYELTTEQREAIGIKDNLVRLSVGVEDAADLIADLEQALDQV